jgi:hypothetical protein
MLQARNHLARATGPVRTRAVVDIDGTLLGQAPTLRLRLAQLGEERLCASETGLLDDHAYSSDLEEELAETRAVYVGAVAFGLAELRGDLDGRNRG